MRLFEDNLDEVLEDIEGPVLLFFTASFCAPSMWIADLLELDDPILDKLTIIKVDIEKFPSSAMKKQVKGTPTVMLVYQGVILANRLGTQPEDEFFNWIEQTLKKI